MIATDCTRTKSACLLPHTPAFYHIILFCVLHFTQKCYFYVKVILDQGGHDTTDLQGFLNCPSQPAQVAGHGAKAPEGQRGLDAAGIANLQDSVKGGLQGAVLVGGEPAKQNAQGLYLIKTDALHPRGKTVMQAQLDFFQGTG